MAPRNNNVRAFNRPVVISDQLTRPADTNAYASGDVIATSTSAPVAQKLLLAAAVEGGYGLIKSARLLDSANQSTKGLFDIFLFNAAVALDNDNAAFTPTDTEMESLVAIIPMYNRNDLLSSADADTPVYTDVVYSGDATSGASGNCVFIRNNLDLMFKCATDSRDLWWFIVPRNAYTPVSGEVFTLALDIMQDR